MADTTTKKVTELFWELKFYNSEGKTSRLLVPLFSKDTIPTAAQVKTAMELLCSLQIFEKDDIQLYVRPKSAAIVERVVDYTNMAVGDAENLN